MAQDQPQQGLPPFLFPDHGISCGYPAFPQTNNFSYFRELTKTINRT
jgi:hypothetical protein